ncbi:MAG TPA: AIPR family protein, partial [Chitinophagaceae bacterium]|nr:AIPR family protein [Chitinophagaceae bacterium]
VIEIFLVSATISARQRTGEIAARAPDFKDETIVVGFQRERERHSKELIILKRLIDINFLYTIYITEGSREPLTIDFAEPPYNNPIPCLRAASEEAFDSYLCVLPASLLAELYKRYSSSLLEKNIRSFLQLKGVNKGMQETVRKEPEKFIAYNNGLTITATESRLEQREGVCYIHALTDFQIVNGGQTTATLYFSQKLGLNIDPVRVMAKINVAKGATDDMLDDLISSISTYSNAQSRVTRIDLRSRSPQLVKIKSLSESVLTVTGKKWFFERARGEYATLLRNNAGRKVQIEKAFPRERRFVKEELAKYYASWGDKPYLVKKGGEKVFRMFLEELSGEGRNKKEAVIDREFYENLVARIIFFRGLERLYGTGYSAMGQLRSAVVPYTLSVVYAYTTGNKKGKPFDLQKIWKAERLEHDLQAVLRKLMELMNTLIRRYSKSDDLGEYTKKQELWEDIIGSKEIVAFMGGAQIAAILKRYALPAEELKKRKSAAGE